jgi:flagellar basal-body rod modification protein FlgD
MDVINPQAAAAQAAVAPQANTSQAKTVLSSDFETFLQMLTAQARYQDPLEPLDSSEYASQLAQFSSVEQQVMTNDLLDAMMSQMGVSNMAQVAGWIGMEARSAAPVMFDGATPVTLTPQPAAGAEEARLIVRNADGDEVRRQVIGVTGQPVQWDGAGLPRGIYSFELESTAQGQVLDTTPVETYARITEARTTEGQSVLILDSGAEVSAAQITALRQPA